jgi:1-acyl-sn-glycerol-3-phosphate acyltransferase
MQMILNYLLTPFYYVAFGLTLAIFHPVQMLALHLGNSEAHTNSVIMLNHFLVLSMRIMGVKMTFEGLDNLPVDRPLIVVSNHQSLFDIQAFVQAFRRFHPKFVSKIELAHGIPSISYNLRHGGSALIDRNNGSQSIREIIRLGRLMEAKKYAVCIYAEGTRNPSGIVQKFQPAGVKTLLKVAPSALVVPFVIDGHDRLMKQGYFPLQFGTKLTYTALQPIEPQQRNAESLVEECEQLIKLHLGQA